MENKKKTDSNKYLKGCFLKEIPEAPFTIEQIGNYGNLLITITKSQLSQVMQDADEKGKSRYMIGNISASLSVNSLLERVDKNGNVKIIIGKKKAPGMYGDTHYVAIAENDNQGTKTSSKSDSIKGNDEDDLLFN